MMNNDFNEKDERFFRYYHDQLSEEERSDFEAQMAQDAELKADYELFVESAVIAESLGVAELAREVVREKAKKKYAVTRYLIGIVATAALVLMGVFIFTPGTTDPETLFAENFKPFPNLDNSRNTAQKSTLGRALEPYDLADYEKAIAMLSRLEPENDTTRIYLGTALLALNKTNEAIEVLNQIHQPLFEEDKTWYLALAALCTHDMIEAKKLLKTFPARSNYRKRADDLLEKLD